MSAKNASIAYNRCIKEGLIPSNWDDLDKDEVSEALEVVANVSQATKPQRNTTKASIIDDFRRCEFKSLVTYTFICLKHEAGMKDISRKHVAEWFDVIYDEFDKKNIPTVAIVGFGDSSFEEKRGSIIAGAVADEL